MIRSLGAAAISAVVDFRGAANEERVGVGEIGRECRRACGRTGIDVPAGSARSSSSAEAGRSSATTIFNVGWLTRFGMCMQSPAMA